MKLIKVLTMEIELPLKTWLGFIRTFNIKYVNNFLLKKSGSSFNLQAKKSIKNETGLVLGIRCPSRLCFSALR